MVTRDYGSPLQVKIMTTSPLCHTKIDSVVLRTGVSHSGNDTTSSAVLSWFTGSHLAFASLGPPCPRTSLISALVALIIKTKAETYSQLFSECWPFNFRT